jgi:CRP/FNR family cyclic AMP-dependent transcriptional regulator
MEDMESIELILAEHPFFRGIELPYLKLLSQCGSRVQFPAGEYLCRADQEARQFYLIHQGRVAVEIFSARRGPITIQTLGDGDVLGWLWFLQPYHWHLDVRTVELTRAVALEVACLRQQCDQNPELGYELMKRYAHDLAVKFRITKLQLVDTFGC